ncbi:hypothetical protein [Xenorhabdus bovienii]|uniref:hypothetical protein n=1 Tax=Xenorhabdus bovienii TaxID=40576 RepID=UPI0023B31125|nr:hypothetical protein [Xenorhabdus bovienii]MDE9441388.1 hypothetical protein [Xenorhabdus bovienii]MDE9457618.1 hypothetical protein [Xenorhabdus bovienii]MDE9514495.1 hypothetical protein [Xenorhabdus bovienii]
MSNQDALFHRVKDDIHFDTLLEQAHQVVEQQAGKLWSDTAEHDPGITLLEGLSYGVSDLAYRHTLPLTDLLTPAPDEQQGGIFPAEFGPHNTLTCGPVTIDDYRKALLDLHSSDWPEKDSPRDEEDFLFRNVQLVREPTENRYTYWYDATKREYSFVKREGATEFTLRGNYWLYLEPTRQTQENLVTATRQLNDFLTKNRNIGESVSQIIWSKPVDFPLSLEIELADDVQDIAGIFAAVYSTAEQYLMPEAQRYRTETLQNAGMSNDEIFEGPRLEHGWIPELPAARDYTEKLTLNLSRLVNKLLEIKGIQNVNRLSLDDSFDKTLIKSDEGETWSWSIKKGYYPRLWGENPLGTLAKKNGGPLRVIAKGGISVSVSEEQIQSRLPRQSLIQNKPVVLAYGQHRNVGRYHPVSDTLPSCYGLQLDLTESEHAQRLLSLHQFMLPFEQLLACGCQQIAMLPQLLAFQRKGYEVWGDQWPFKSGSVNDDAHKNYAPALKLLLKQIANDSDHELDIVNYLLGYFGTQRAPHTFTTPIEDFRAVQQGYLAQQPTLTYHRANIRIDQVSSLQKRIAARMGLGGELFKSKPDLSKLPFYLVEHRALLPIKPNEEQTPDSVKMDADGLVIEQAGIDGKLKQGQLIDLTVFEKRESRNIRFMIRGQRVTKIEQDKFWLDVSNNPQLEQDLKWVMKSAEEKQLTWQNSQFDFDKEQMPDSVKMDKGRLVIEQAGIDSYLRQGQLIDLILPETKHGRGTRPMIRGQVVTKIEQGKFWLDLDKSEELRDNVEWVRRAYETKQLFWQNSQLDKEQMPDSVTFERDSEIGRYYLVIEQAGIDSNLRQGQLIDLILFEKDRGIEYRFMIRGQRVTKIEQDKFWLGLDNNPQLRDNVEWVRRAYETKQLFWQNIQLDKEQMPDSVTFERDSEIGRHYLVIEQAGIDSKLREGQLIDLILPEKYRGRENRFMIRGQRVTKIEQGKFWLDVRNSPQLRQYLRWIIQSAEEKQLTWQNTQFAKEQTPELVTKEKGSQADQLYLVIQQAGIGINLKQGQVIDLILYEGEQQENRLTMRGQMVSKTEEDKIWLDVGNSAQLEHHLERVMAAASAKQLFWQNSEVWMEDMNYRLAYDSDQSLLLKNQKRLTRTAQTPFPAMIAVGNEITLTKVGLEQASSDESKKLYAKVVSFDRIEGTLIIDSQDLSKFPKPEEAWQYSWHFSGKEYEKTDHFSFVISIVVNRDLIEKLPNVDPYKLEEWVKETILTEFPAHISMIIHWMDQDKFLNFAHTYQHWQNNGAPLGDAAYSILESLTLGKLPSSLKGIGTMRIATEDQRKKQLGHDEKEWNIKKIIQDELFYVPKESKE